MLWVRWGHPGVAHNATQKWCKYTPDSPTSLLGNMGWYLTLSSNGMSASCMHHFWVAPHACITSEWRRCTGVGSNATRKWPKSVQFGDLVCGLVWSCPRLWIIWCEPIELGFPSLCPSIMYIYFSIHVSHMTYENECQDWALVCLFNS